MSETLLPPDPRTVALVRPVTMKQLVKALDDLVPAEDEATG